jgi:hypothetical protein
MRLFVVVLSVVVLFAIGGSLVIGALPLAPALQHVEQRITNEQLPH